jgi:hypothetical protein
VLDYIAYLTAQETGVALSRSALPDAPVAAMATVPRPGRLRRRTASALQRLAERIQPA